MDEDRSTIYSCKINPNAENSSWAEMIRYIDGSDKRILDVGCACGDLGVALKSVHDVQLFGLELNPESARIARETGAYDRVDVCDLDRISSSNFSDFVGTFDYIICGDILEHLRDPEATLKVLRQYLRPSGELIASIPNVAHMYVKANLLINNFNYTASGLLDETHIHFFTYKSIVKTLVASGFDLQACAFTFCCENEWNPNSDPYPHLPIYVKRALFSDYHSYVCQYVVRAKLLAPSSIQDETFQHAIGILDINASSAPSYISEYRQKLLGSLEETMEEKEIKALRFERDALAGERDTLLIERDALASDRNRILNSTSWRMTKPIRFVLDNLKARYYGKLIRGTIKQFIPYGIMVWWLRCHYDKCIDMPLFYYPGFGKSLYRLVKFSLPYGFVRLIQVIFKHPGETVNGMTERRDKDWRRSRGLERVWTKTCVNILPDEVRGLCAGDRQWAAGIGETIDIIIPVYNGLAHLQRLIPSLIKNTSQRHRFIFVDDCSPDTSVGEYIQQQFDGRTDWIMLRNERNMGFPGSVNHAAREVESSIFVLLNTDAVVPENWLERLIAPFAHDKKIATTTPFSNSAVFFSYPNFGSDHRVADPQQFLAADEYFSRLRPKREPLLEFVNGTGFCMAIRSACWLRYGGLDEKAFGRGYGEECDWCMRVMGDGWKHVLVPNLYVYHNHGGSFQPTDKQALVAEHSKVLRTRWGCYLDVIDVFVRTDPWSRFRLAVQCEVYNQSVDELIIDINQEDGGACLFRRRREMELLQAGHRVATLQYTTNNNKCEWFLAFPNADGHGRSRIGDIDAALKWVEYLRPKSIVINNLIHCWDYESIIAFLIKMKTGIGEGLRLSYCFHDFLSCCPSFFLLNNNQLYCGIASCEICLPQNTNAIFQCKNIALWRACWGRLLDACDELRFFSENTKRIVSSVYQLKSNKVKVIPHKQIIKFEAQYIRPEKNASLVLALIGNWSASKGSRQVAQLAEILQRERPEAKILFFGREYEPRVSAANIEWRGAYDAKDLPQLLSREGVKAVLLPSVCPETFSFVAQECIDIEVPIIAFAIGASGDRIAKYKYGFIAEEFTGASLYKQVLQLERMLYR